MTGGTISLGEIAARLTMVEVACNRCDRRGRLNVARLVEEHGAACPGPDLLRHLSADCPKRIASKLHDVCGIHMPDLPRVF